MYRASAVIGEGATVHKDAVIGMNVTIGDGVQVHKGAHIGNDCRIGAGCVIQHNARIHTGARLGDMVTVGIGAIVSAGVHLLDGDIIPNGGGAKNSPHTREKAEEAERQAFLAAAPTSSAAAYNLGRA